MRVVDSDIVMSVNVPITTWFGVGGRADRLVKPAHEVELREALARYSGDGPVRALGEGANLLVDDAGVDGLVVSLDRFDAVEFVADDPGLVRAGAGARLPQIIIETCRRGLAGIEGLAGIPASLGGAVAMNAGGAFGAIADVVERVQCVDCSTGETLERTSSDLAFGYRKCDMKNTIVTRVDLRLRPDDPDEIRARLKAAMAYKKTSQPLREKSAGCVFKNPRVDSERVSAGRLIDESGCKGMREGLAEVSSVHANFIVTHEGAKARDVIALIERVRERVERERNVTLEQEVVVWKRQ